MQKTGARFYIWTPKKKKKKILFGEEHATSHIQAGTAVIELPKYVLQGNIWQVVEL